ncbi:MAG: hypothetical protein WEA56_08735 [Balneolaceae bacterium]
MNPALKASFLITVMMSVISFGSGNDHETVTGQLSGFDCAVVGELCPTTHRGADYTTGVYTEDEEFFFIVNIPQSFLQQYFRETIEVEGTVYNPYNQAIEPETIHLVDGSEKTLVYDSGYFIDENNGRATFQNGEFLNGKWVAQ